MTTSYFILKNGQSTGPYSMDDLRQAKLLTDTLVWREGLTNWIPLSALPEWSLSQPTPANTPWGPTRFLFGSLTSDWQAAAWATLGVASLYYFNEAFPLNQHVYNWLRIVPFAIYVWGLLQVGQAFNLKGIRQTSRWLFVNELLIVAGIGNSGWLTFVLAGVTLLIRVKMMVDLWTLRSVLLAPMVTTLVVTQAIDLLNDGFQLTNAYLNGVVYIVNRVCMALLFYELIRYTQSDLNTPPEPPSYVMPAA